MTATTHRAPLPPMHRTVKAMGLALRLARAENELRAHTSDEVDAVIDSDGNTYLLRPAQEHLRQSERRLAAAIESVADVIIIVNRGGVILSQTGAVNRVLGYEPEELVGSSIFDLLHEDDVPQLYFPLIEVIEGFRENVTNHFRHRACDGSYRMVEATLAKLLDDSSTSVVIRLRPVTGPPRRRTGPARPNASEERLDRAKPAMDTIGQKHEREVGLLEESPDLTKSSHLKARLESIDAHEAVRSAVQLCHREIAASQVEVLLDLRAEEHIVHADWAVLLEVMCDLVKNTVKFSVPGSRIPIASTNDLPGRLTFELVDHGVPVEPAPGPRDPDSARQGALPAQQLHGGLLSALKIARSLAEAEGGTLTVSSEGPGKSATFRLTLNTAPPPSAPLSILLAEDREDGALADLLERCGYTVIAVADMFTAIAIAVNCRIDLVISDITLPDGTGHELMQQLRALQPSLAGIDVRDFEMTTDIDESLASEFSEHLFRPVTADSLRATIQAVAAKRREARDETAVAA